MSLQTTLRIAFILYATSLFVGTVQAATILTFENSGNIVDNASNPSSPFYHGAHGVDAPVDPRYGVDVASATQAEGDRDVAFGYGTTDGTYTPHIAVAYSVNFHTDFASTADSQPGMPTPFVYLAGNPATMTFTAAPGYHVALQSFQIGALPTSVVPVTVTITDQTSTTLYSYSGTLTTGTPVTFGVGSLSNPLLDPFLGAVGTQLTLSVTGTGGFTGVGSITFAELAPVPEPSTVVLAITGALGLLVTRPGRRMARVWLNRQKCC